MSTADEAFRAAEQLIAEIKAKGGTGLSFHAEVFRALEHLPPELVGLSGLRSIQLGRTKVADDALELISELKSLRDLRLDETRISDDGMRRIAALSGLQMLSVSKTNISDQSLKHISALPELSNLYLGNTHITDQGLRYVGALLKLIELRVDATKITDEGLGYFATLAELRTLSLSGTQISDDGLATLSQLTKLNSLMLTGTSITGEGLGYLSGLADLNHLYVGYSPITNDALRHISKYSGLQTLSLANTKIDDSGLDHISTLAAISNLYLNGTRITDDGLHRISGLSKLRSLSLTDTLITDRGLDAIVDFFNLQGLYLEGTPVSNDGLRRLSRLTELSTLHLDRTQVSDLRPVLAFDKLWNGRLTFRQIPALEHDLKLDALSKIEDDRDRTAETLAYLKEVVDDWPPIPQEPPKQDDFLTVSLGVDGRLDIRPALPSGVELADTVKQKAHLRLVDKLDALAQVAGNRFPRLANAARKLWARLDCAFEEIDMLEVHFDIEGMRGTYERRNEGIGEERLSQDVISALDDVLIVGPGLVLDNEEVEKADIRRDRYRGIISHENIAAQDVVSDVIVGSPDFFGDRMRDYSAGFKAGSHHDMDRLRTGQATLNRNTLIVIGLGAAQSILGGPMGEIGNQLIIWLAQNHVALSAAMPGWGDATRVWLTPILMRAREFYLASKYLSGI